jgi:hypothetical protein
MRRCQGGVASDSANVQATTANLKSLPTIGPRIASGVQRTEEAAGRHVEDVAGQMAGPADGSRAAADTVVRPGIQAAIDTNRVAIDAAYTGLRGLIHQHPVPMPRTDRMLDEIMRTRHAAGHVDPAAGLEHPSPAP